MMIWVWYTAKRFMHAWTSAVDTITLALTVVMFIVYQEENNDEVCCSEDAKDRFMTEGQTDLQKYFEKKRLLTLNRNGSINKPQVQAIAAFLGVGLDCACAITEQPLRQSPRQVSMDC